LSDIPGEVRAGGRFADELGIEVLRAEDGEADLRMTVRDDMVNVTGTCHGGLIFTLADSAAGTAAFSTGVPAIAQQASINWLRPANVGDVLTASARQITGAGRSVILNVTVRDQSGADVAIFQGLCRVLRS
jgi:acyl-CoA thioesterase